eukprot:Transcript_21786.p1 GENE.Transcript_21786~~Transcript_21786.p1  ORF type:complete len:860 (-),score=125.85 Transcript_21786:182-2761(-)
MFKDKRHSSGPIAVSSAAAAKHGCLPKIDALADDADLSAFRAPLTKAAQSYSAASAAPSFLLGTPGGRANIPAPCLQLSSAAAPTPRPAATWLTSLAGLPSSSIHDVTPSCDTAAVQLEPSRPAVSSLGLRASPLAPPPSAKRDRAVFGNPSEPSAKQPRLTPGAPPLVSSSASSVAAQRILRTLDMLDTPLRHTRPMRAVPSSPASSGREAAKEAAPSAKPGPLAEPPPLRSFIDATPTRLLCAAPPGTADRAARAPVPAVALSVPSGSVPSPPLMPPAPTTSAAMPPPPLAAAGGSSGASVAATASAIPTFGCLLAAAPALSGRAAAAKQPSFGGFSMPPNDCGAAGGEEDHGPGQGVPLPPCSSAQSAAKAPAPASLKAPTVSSHRPHATAPPPTSSDTHIAASAFPAPSGGFGGATTPSATPGAPAAKPFGSPAPATTPMAAATPMGHRYFFTPSEALAAQSKAASVLKSPTIFSFSKKGRAAAEDAAAPATEDVPLAAWLTPPAPAVLPPFAAKPAAMPAGEAAHKALDSSFAFGAALTKKAAVSPNAAPRNAAPPVLNGFGVAAASTGVAKDGAAARSFGNTPLSQQQLRGGSPLADHNFGNTPPSLQEGEEAKKPPALLFGGAASTSAFGAPASTPASLPASTLAPFTFGLAAPAADKPSPPVFRCGGGTSTPPKPAPSSKTVAFGCEAPTDKPSDAPAPTPHPLTFGAAAPTLGAFVPAVTSAAVPLLAATTPLGAASSCFSFGATSSATPAFTPSANPIFNGMSAASTYGRPSSGAPANPSGFDFGAAAGTPGLPDSSPFGGANVLATPSAAGAAGGFSVGAQDGMGQNQGGAQRTIRKFRRPSGRSGAR